MTQNECMIKRQFVLNHLNCQIVIKSGLKYHVTENVIKWLACGSSLMTFTMMSSVQYNLPFHVKNMYLKYLRNSYYLEKWISQNSMYHQLYSKHHTIVWSLLDGSERISTVNVWKKSSVIFAEFTNCHSVTKDGGRKWNEGVEAYQLSTGLI